jgi:transposase
MRGRFFDQGGMFSYIQPERRIPADHPLRKVRELVREVLKELSPTFGNLYSHEGRPSIPPEQLLSALLLQVFYSIRSERQLMEQIDYNLLFRWFVGLSPDDPIWDATVFTKNRERLQEGDVFQKFMAKLLEHQKVKPLLSDEHFSVDGTLIEAWASHKSFKPKARTFTARCARTTRIKARPTPKPSSTARRTGARPSSATWAMRSWRTGTALLSAAPSQKRTARPNGELRKLCSRRRPRAQSASPSARTKLTTPAITLRHCAA